MDAIDKAKTSTQSSLPSCRWMAADASRLGKVRVDSSSSSSSSSLVDADGRRSRKTPVPKWALLTGWPSESKKKKKWVLRRDQCVLYIVQCMMSFSWKDW